MLTKKIEDIGDYGNKRHICHLKEHLYQFLLPHTTAFKNKYHVDIKDFIEDINLIYSIFHDSIETAEHVITDTNDLSNISNIDIDKQHIQVLSNILKKINNGIKIHNSPSYDFFKEELSLQALLLIFTDKIIDNKDNIKIFNSKALQEDMMYDCKSFLEVYEESQKKLQKQQNNKYIKDGSYIDHQNKDYKRLKPFVRLHNKFYSTCLIDDLFVMNYLDRFIIDHIYKDKNDFTTIHAPAFEEHVAIFFKKLFPYAKFYSSYFYRDKRNEKMESVEIDLLITIDDICLICEIKSGRMVYGGKSIESIYEKPQEEQLKNFLDKIDKDYSVELKNKSGCKFTLDKNNYSKIIPILITQDTLQFYSVAKKKDYGLAYSIDDLRIFRDVLNPLYLLDFFDKHLFYNKTLCKNTLAADNIDIFESYINGTIINDINDIINFKNVAIAVHLQSNNNAFINNYLHNKYIKKFNIELLKPKVLTKELDELASKILASNQQYKYSAFMKLMFIILEKHEEIIAFYSKALKELKFLAGLIESAFGFGLFIVNVNKATPLSNNIVKKQSYNMAVNQGLDKNNCTLVRVYVNNNGNIDNIIIDYYQN